MTAGISTDAAMRLSIATETVSQMSDEEWNAFAAAEKARRNTTSESLKHNQRVRFVAATRPTRIALATGKITDVKYSGAKGWIYQVKMDTDIAAGYPLAETFIRIPRSSLEIIADDAPVNAPGSRKKSTGRRFY